MPHHRKPCMHGTNTPPCFIAAVSSHWCSHREICLDAFAGSDAENSRCQRAEYVVVGGSVFFFCCCCCFPFFLSGVYLTISCVQEAWMRFIFTFRWKDTHQGRHTSPANAKAFESTAVDKSSVCSPLAVPFVVLLPRWLLVGRVNCGVYCMWAPRCPLCWWAKTSLSLFPGSRGLRQCRKEVPQTCCGALCRTSS